MRKLLLLIIPVLIFSCNAPCKENDKVEEKVSFSDSIRANEIKRDLPELKKDGVLKAITIYSSTSYFIYRGKPMGFDYELLIRLADYLGLKLEIVVARDIDNLINMLIRGDGDMIAYALTITDNRRKVIDFTQYHARTHQALIQKKPDNWRKIKLHEIDRVLKSDVLDMIGDTVWVRRESPYYERVKNLNNEIGDTIYVEFLPGEMDTEEIIEKVAEGKIKYTIADYNIASILSSYYHNIDIKVPVSLSQRLAWAVRKNSPKLKEAINDWITKIKKTDDYYVIYHKYFKNSNKYRSINNSRYFTKKTGQISPYDKIIKKNSSLFGYDWRLLASVIYQESRFDVNSKAWTGASGLMQLMPSTARSMGITNPKDPEQNIHGGTKYIRHLCDRWSEIADSIQRIKFALASYNCGYNHVVDARNLTFKYGGDGNMWDNNTENYIKLLSRPKYYNDPVVKYGYVRGIEPYNYVREIFNRYELYKDVIPE